MGALAALRIDGPPPSAPFGIVTTPGTIVPEEDAHWQAGVILEGYPTDLPETHDPCSQGSQRVKSEGEDPPMPEFSSFTVYLPVSCSGIGLGNEAGAERLRARAREAFQALETYGVERELMFGDANAVDKPFIADANATIIPPGGGAVGPREALALLEQAIGVTARNGFVHIDPATAVMLFSHDLLIAEGATLKTRRGNTVIVGNGYIGATPADDPDQPELDRAWAFATGPVRLTRSEVVVLGTTSQSLDHRTNDVTFRAERNYVAYWDAALQAAVEVDRSANP